MKTFLKMLPVLCLFFLSTACEGIYVVPDTVYLIRKGTHKSLVEEKAVSRHGFRTIKSDQLFFTARFDESAIYQLSEEDQGDINKLMGVADCNSHHQTNSARFGWSYNIDEGAVDIYAYVYYQGDRLVQKLGQAPIGSTMSYRLTITDKEFVFEFDGSATSFDRGSSCQLGVYYQLFPYFGGNHPAPHDIRIYLKEEY